MRVGKGDEDVSVAMSGDFDSGVTDVEVKSLGRQGMEHM